MLSSKKKIYIKFIHNTVAAFIAEFGIFPLSIPSGASQSRYGKYQTLNKGSEDYNTLRGDEYHPQIRHKEYQEETHLHNDRQRGWEDN